MAPPGDRLDLRLNLPLLCIVYFLSLGMARENNADVALIGMASLSLVMYLHNIRMGDEPRCLLKTARKRGNHGKWRSTAC